MASRLRITTAAKEDLDIIYDRYERQRSGLGAKFTQRFHVCVERILQSPEMHELVLGNYRRTMLRKFPYAVFYELVNDEVIIHAVLHTARDSSAWQSRLE